MQIEETMKVPLMYVFLASAIFTISVGEVCLVDFGERGKPPDDSTGINGTVTFLGEAKIEFVPDTSTAFVTCPNPDDPPNYTACCYDSSDSNATTAYPHADVPRCCPPLDLPGLFYFISDRLALIIVVALTVTLLIVTIVVIICCFWSRCPLYMLCRVRYRRDDVIAYACKDEETANLNEMPPDEQKGVTIYSPNPVKVTSLDKDV